MASTLTNFLVGIGYDYDSKGEQQIGSGIDSIKSKALQLGAVVAGAFGIKSLTGDFAKANDSLGKFSQVFGVIPNDVAALGRALEHEGGSLESFMGQLEGIERFRAGLRVGDASMIAAAGIAGIDTAPIENAKDATEAYVLLGEQFAKLNQQERINAADALGLDEASIRLLSQGSDAIRAAMREQQVMRPVTAAMTEESARFNDEWQDVQTNIGGFADKISMTVTPAISDLMSGMNDWLGVNREFINQGLDTTLELIGENLGLVVAAGGLLASGGLLTGLSTMAATIPIIGSALASAAVGAGALLGVGAAAAGGVAVGGIINENLDEETKLDIGRGIAHTLAFFGNEEAQAAIDAENAAIAAGGTLMNPAGINGMTIPSAQPTPPQQQNNPVIKVDLNMDGKVIERKIIDTNNRQYEQALNDVTTSTGG